MRIALVSPYDYPYPGGVTEHVQHLKRQYQARGHYVRVIAPSSADADNLEEDVYKVGGILPFGASGSIVRITVSPRAYRRVKTILGHERFDIVHCHEPLMPLLPLVALRHSKAVNIGTFHAFRESQAGYAYGRPVLQRVMGRLHGRVCVSQASWQLISKYFPGEYRIIPNGIDLQQFGGDGVAPLPQYDDGMLNVLFLGRMDERKGFPFLLNAFPAVKHVIPNARLIVAGGYTEEDIAPYRRQVAEQRLSDVVFVGRVSEAEKPRYYRGCHVFCAPSTGFESQGIVLLEAMASARPIVASNIAGYSGVVTDGVEGILVPPKSEAALAAALVRLLCSDEMRRSMGQRGQQHVQRYSWDKVASELLSFYSDVKQKAERRGHLREVLHAR